MTCCWGSSISSTWWCTWLGWAEKARRWEVSVRRENLHFSGSRVFNRCIFFDSLSLQRRCLMLVLWRKKEMEVKARGDGVVWCCWLGSDLTHPRHFKMKCAFFFFFWTKILNGLLGPIIGSKWSLRYVVSIGSTL